MVAYRRRPSDRTYKISSVQHHALWIYKILRVLFLMVVMETHLKQRVSIKFCFKSDLMLRRLKMLNGGQVESSSSDTIQHSLLSVSSVGRRRLTHESTSIRFRLGGISELNIQPAGEVGATSQQVVCGAPSTYAGTWKLKVEMSY